MSRRENAVRKDQMRAALRRACDDGSLPEGALAPSVRELAERHGLSSFVVHTVLRELTDEGLFYTVPAVGTFVAPRRRAAEAEAGGAGAGAGGGSEELYLFASGDTRVRTAEELVNDLSAVGFSVRVAERGGASLVLRHRAAAVLYERRELPGVQGVFGPTFAPRAAFEGVPCAAFAGQAGEYAGFADEVGFDDVGGGRLAAEHLLALGHRRLAYVGLHVPGRVPPGTVWSEEREAGWRAALEAAGVPPGDGLAIHPAEPGVSGERAGRDAAAAVAARLPALTAVVAANDATALALLDGLREQGVPRVLWPALVGFDNLARDGGQVLTSLHRPQDALGRAAADLLIDRRRGALSGPPVRRRVPMQLVPRVTSRAGWSSRRDTEGLLPALLGKG